MVAITVVADSRGARCETDAAIGIVSAADERPRRAVGRLIRVERLSPMRSSFTQYGALFSVPTWLTVAAPAASRRWKSVPLPCVTSMKALGEPGVNVSRIITPALADVEVFCRLLTRATMKPSPFSGR